MCATHILCHVCLYIDSVFHGVSETQTVPQQPSFTERKIRVVLLQMQALCRCDGCFLLGFCAEYHDISSQHKHMLQLPTTSLLSLSLMQGAIHTTPHQQHHCSAEHTHAAAICGFVPVVLHSVVGCQDTQLLQLCPFLAGAAAHAGPHLCHAVHYLQECQSS